MSLKIYKKSKSSITITKEDAKQAIMRRYRIPESAVKQVILSGGEFNVIVDPDHKKVRHKGVVKRKGTDPLINPKKKRVVKKRTVRKRIVKKRNPVALSKAAKLKKAGELYQDFSGHTPEFLDKVNVRIPDVILGVGDCDGILYTTVRDGKKEKYVHKFKARSKPMLAASHDGKILLLLDGKFTFTERGIVDD